MMHVHQQVTAHFSNFLLHYHFNTRVPELLVLSKVCRTACCSKVQSVHWVHTVASYLHVQDLSTAAGACVIKRLVYKGQQLSGGTCAQDRQQPVNHVEHQFMTSSSGAPEAPEPDPGNGSQCACLKTVA